MGISALLAAQILDASATGRSVLTGADASAIRSTLGLGTLATQSPTGTPSASTFLRGDYSWQTIDLSGYVPYTGATGAVNLGSNALTAGAGTFSGLISATADLQHRLSQSIVYGDNTWGARWKWSGGGNGIGMASASLLPAVSSAMSLGEWNYTGFTSLYLATGASAANNGVILLPDSVHTLGIRNSTNAQRLNLYGTFTDASNYRRLFLSSTTAGAFTLGVEGAGTGASGNTLTVGPAIFKTNDNEIYGVVKNGTSGSDASRLFIWADGRQQARFGYASGYDGLLLGDGSYGPMIWMGGATSSFPAIKRNGTALNFRLADDSANCNITAASATLSTGTITASSPALNVTQTWNNAATTFTGILANVTDTASNAASLLMQLQKSGSDRLTLTKHGALTSIIDQTQISSGLIVKDLNGVTYFTAGYGGVSTQNSVAQLTSNGTIGNCNIGAGLLHLTHSGSGTSAKANINTYYDLVIAPGGISGGAASSVVEQRNGLNPQVHRIYNTFTDASNYERAKIAWESNVLRIGTEKAGTGSARALELQTDGTTRLTIDTSGNTTLASGTSLNVGGATTACLISSNSGVARIDFLVGGSYVGNINSSSNTLRLRAPSGVAVRNNNDTADAAITAAAATFSGNVTVSAVNLVTDTTTGTKIGTATTQKLGFYNATPIVQPTAVADATDAASVITQLNALLSRMRDLGLIAT